MIKDKILIFGNGQIGNFYKRFFDEKKIDSSIGMVDITKKAEVETEIDEYKPTVVINTAGKTNLEWCNNNRLEAINVNVLGANNIAQVCDEKQIYFIHISSGCILGSRGGDDAKKEGDIPNPTSFYSWTKVWGENVIPFKKSSSFRYLILRPRQPVSTQVTYMNMLVKMLTFSKWIDVPNSGTVVEDWIEWTLLFLEKKPVGIYHLANEGYSTPVEIGKLLKKYILPSLPIEVISKSELNKLTPEMRVDTVLDVSKLKTFGATVKPYSERLEEIIQELGKNIKKMNKKELKEQLEKTVTMTKTRSVPNDVWPQLLK